MGKHMFVYPKKGETFAIGCLFHSLFRPGDTIFKYRVCYNEYSSLY